MLNGRDWNSGDPYDMKKYTASATAEFYKGIMDQASPNTIDYANVSQSIKDLHLDRVPGFAMPWQNAGESWLPTLTGSLAGTSPKDYMDDYRATAYDRLSAEARENTTRWINATGKLDPNMKLEGVDYMLQEGGLYHTSDQSVDLAFDHFLGDYVKPGENSEFTRFDADTGDYVLTEEGKRQKEQQQEPAAPDTTEETFDALLRKAEGQDDDAPKEEAVAAATDDFWSQMNTWDGFDEDVQEEARQRLAKEKAQQREEAEKQAAMDADLEAYRAMLDQRDAYASDRKRDRGTAFLEYQRWLDTYGDDDEPTGRTKADLEAQRAELQREDDLAEWRRLGARLGMLSDDDERPTHSTSHVPDVTPSAMEAVHIVGDHPMHSLSAGALGALRTLAVPKPQSQLMSAMEKARASAVKVI